jgi:surface polysaccharide O-acyltransferase-like enzyme
MIHSWQDNAAEQTLKMVGPPLYCVAVNCFVLISGWFSIKLNWRKLLHLNTMVTFWAVALGILALVLGVHTFIPKIDFLMLFPVITYKYWFITVYFALCILSPALNILVEHLDKDSFKQLLLSMFGVFVVLSTVAYTLNFDTITRDHGYGIVNFVFMYLMGRYLRLHYVANHNKYVYLLGYFGVAFLCYLTQLINVKVLGLSYKDFCCYDLIFMSVGAMCLFLFFSKLNFTNKIINWLATFCLATYVIHLHPWMFRPLYKNFLGGGAITGPEFVLFMIIMPFVTFAACIILESTRRFVFKSVTLLFNR